MAWQLLATGEYVAIELFPDIITLTDFFFFFIKSSLDQKLYSLEDHLLDLNRMLLHVFGWFVILEPV